jgi:DinB superfamily
MKHDQLLRGHLVALLTEDAAHLKFDSAVEDLPVALLGKRPEGAAHSLWELVEHMRITQKDILEFCRNPKHISPEFPAGYWPGQAGPANEKGWNDSVSAFRADLRALAELVTDPAIDLLPPLPHAQDKTLLREALLAADHNSYHLGQLVVVRRLLGTWKS